MVKVIIDREKCIGCGLCVQDCLARAISLESGRAEVKKLCFCCGHCVAICPAEAVRLEGGGYDMADVESVGAGFGIDGDAMLHAIKTRRSVRRYREDCPERALLEKVLEAGRFSPTGSNAQNVSYIVFTEKTEELRSLAMEELRRYGQSDESFAQVFPPPMSRSRMYMEDDDFLFKGAPALILTVSPNAVNASIASANMELQAVSMGLGMLYVGYFTRLAAKSPALREYLGLAEQDQVVTCLALGWPDVRYRRSVPRKKAQVSWR